MTFEIGQRVNVVGGRKGKITGAYAPNASWYVEIEGQSQPEIFSEVFLAPDNSRIIPEIGKRIMVSGRGKGIVVGRFDEYNWLIQFDSFTMEELMPEAINEKYICEIAVPVKPPFPIFSLARWCETDNGF